MTLEELLSPFSGEDLSNLAKLLEMDSSVDAPGVSDICERIRWLYHSRTSARIESSLGNAKNRLKNWRHPTEQMPAKVSKEIPQYEVLIREAAKKLGVYEGLPSLEECERYIAHAVIIAALERMKPSERAQFFMEAVPFEAIPEGRALPNNEMHGPVTTIALLGAAQASGFGIYVAATTALGFLTNAIGVALPFAVYTGLTSTIAFVIGPAGWLTAGIWGGWKLMQPEWKKLIPGLLYIAAVRHRSATNVPKLA